MITTNRSLQVLGTALSYGNFGRPTFSPEDLYKTFQLCYQNHPEEYGKVRMDLSDIERIIQNIQRDIELGLLDPLDPNLAIRNVDVRHDLFRGKDFMSMLVAAALEDKGDMSLEDLHKAVYPMSRTSLLTTLKAQKEGYVFSETPDGLWTLERADFLPVVGTFYDRRKLRKITNPPPVPTLSEILGSDNPLLEALKGIEEIRSNAKMPAITDIPNISDTLMNANPLPSVLRDALGKKPGNEELRDRKLAVLRTALVKLVHLVDTLFPTSRKA